MNRARLEEMKRFLLEDVDRKRFNIDTFGIAKMSKFEAGNTPVKVTCITAACAWGWAGLNPKFQKMGVELKRIAYDNLSPTYKGKRDFDAAMEFFKINWPEALYLFAGGSYKYRSGPRKGHFINRVTVRDVARHIDDLLKGKVEFDEEDDE